METESPKNFESIIADFTKDLTTVFPEYAHLWSKLECSSNKLHAYCLAIYPERFFDILYSNADIFAPGSKVNVAFLPGVDFRLLYNCEGVSENTRNSIWKYLQLLLFTLMGSMKDAKNFGDSANIFEAMDENELHSKIAETMSGISGFFKDMQSEGAAASEPNEGSNEGTSEGNTEGTSSAEGTHNPNSSKDFFANMPDPEELHEHMKGLLEGKLGKLAKEFTDEFTSEIEGIFSDGDMQNAKSSKDILMQIIKNPQKMIVIFKRLAAKLQDKMKNGEISQEEMMAEMGGIMEKMKGMGGGKGDLAEMMKSMKDLPFMKMLEKTLGGKVDMNAMNRMTQQSATKERMLKKMEQRQQAQAQAQAQAQMQQTGSNSYVVKIGDEKQEKSGLKPPTTFVAPIASPAPIALSEDELIKLFNAESSSKKQKKPKKAK
jgi:hypothetical protein